MLLADPRRELPRAAAPRQVDAQAFLKLAAALEQVRTVSDLLHVSRHQLQDVLPHGAFVLVSAPAGTSGSQACAVFGSHVPDDDLEWLRRDGWRRSPAARSGLGSDEPEFFEPAGPCRGVDADWLERFRRSELRNMLTCGVRHIHPARIISFNFFRLPDRPQARHRQALKLAIPHLHHPVLRIHPANDAVPMPSGEARATLTPREREVLDWMRRGKTNAEIAVILGVAYKTVKNQVQSILVKLRVNNRAQAVARAIERGLI